MMTEQYDLLEFVDVMALLVRSRKVEHILVDLCKIAVGVNLFAAGNPPDFEFVLKMKTGSYEGVGTDPKDAILMALKRAKEAMGETKTDG